MDGDLQKELRDALDLVEQAQQKLRALEARLEPGAQAAAPVAPAPEQAATPTPPTQPAAEAQPEPMPQFSIPKAPPIVIPVTTAPPSEPKRSGSTESLEEVLGRKLLPWLGAALVLVGIGFLVNLAIQYGWLTPTLQFAGALGISFALIPIGVRLEKRHAQFGSLVSGIGSSGVYLSLAGGAAGFHLYSNQVMLELLLTWAVANLAYGAVRSSMSFGFLGLAGGVGAAWMARTDSLTTFAQISFGAFAIALIISDLRKWFPLAWTAFTTIVFALISISWVGLQDHAADPWMIANLAYASGFLMFLHWIRSQPKTEFEGGVLVLLVTLLLSHVTSGSTGVAASLLFTIATAGAAWLIAKPQDKGAALAQPAAGFLLLGPLHWRGDPLGPICTLIALALAAMTARRPREWMLLLAVFNGSLGAAWLLKLDELQGVLWAKVPQAWLWWIALWATTLLLAAPFRTCWAKHKEVIYVLVLGPANFATWEAALFLLLRSLGLDHAAASSGGIALYGLGYMTAGSLAKIGEMRVAGLLAILVCTAKLFLVDLTILPLGTRVALFILFGLAVLAASYFFYVKRQKDQEPSAL